MVAGEESPSGELPAAGGHHSRGVVCDAAALLAGFLHSCFHQVKQIRGYNGFANALNSRKCTWNGQNPLCKCETPGKLHLDKAK